MDLVAFLRARLDEDEAVARDWPDEMDVRWYKVPTYTPARVLREVEAKRAIVDLHQLETAYLESRDDDYRPIKIPEVQCYICGWVSDLEGWACQTLRALAAVYRDHPDYDPAWRP
jgi:hypothetical protein